MGILGDIPNLDPHQLAVPVPDVTFSMWDRLLAYGPNLQVLRQRAESFDMSADGCQLKLTLRKAGPNARTQPVGTGPFTFGEWVQGDHIRLLKNKKYWMTGQPYVDDEVYFQI